MDIRLNLKNSNQVNGAPYFSYDYFIIDCVIAKSWAKISVGFIHVSNLSSNYMKMIHLLQTCNMKRLSHTEFLFIFLNIFHATTMIKAETNIWQHQGPPLEA